MSITPALITNLKKANERLKIIKKQERVEKSRNSITYFAKTYFPDIFNKPFSKAHTDIFNNLDFKKGFKLLRIMPRGHGKSVTLSLLIPIYAVCFNLKSFIVMFSSNQTNANNLILDIRNEFEANELIINDFELTPKYAVINKQTTDWSKSKLTFSNDTKIMGVGVGTKIRGVRKGANRPDLLIFDDIEDIENVATPESRKKLEEWFTAVAIPLQGYDLASYIMSGTILHEEALIENLFQQKQNRWDCKKYKAIYDWNKKTVLWKNAWTFNKLMKIRDDIGEVSFLQEYQNIPISSQVSVFDIEKFKYFDIKSVKKENFIFFAGIDLATGEAKDDPDFSSFVVVGVNKTTKRLYVFENIYSSRKTPLQFLISLIPYIIKYEIIKVAIEKNNFISDIVLEFKKQLRNKNYNVDLLNIYNKENKVLRILSLEKYFISERMLFRKDWYKSYKELIDEFKYFGARGVKDDCVDSLELVTRLVQPYLNQDKSNYIGGI